MNIFSFFSLLGGLAFFLFGMNIMGTSLEKLSGGKLEKVLEKLTSSPIKGVFLGLAVTAVIQSSSATTVMVVRKHRNDSYGVDTEPYGTSGRRPADKPSQTDEFFACYRTCGHCALYVL